MKTIGFMILLVGLSGSAMAGIAPPLPSVPEIDSGSAIGAMVLLSGALLVIRARRRGSK